MSPPSFHIFAARQDILEVFEPFETEREVRYTRCAFGPAQDTTQFERCRDLPDLGLARSSSTVTEPRYLVSDRHVELRPRAVVQKAGGVWFSYDPTLDVDTINFRPGGVHETGCVLAGLIETGSDTKQARDLLRGVTRRVVKQFRRVRSYWVGPVAHEMWKRGARLTIGLHASRSLDLAEPPPRS